MVGLSIGEGGSGSGLGVASRLPFIEPNMKARYKPIPRTIRLNIPMWQR